MSSSHCIAPDLVREQVRADLDAIDTAYGRLRAVSTDRVGQGFRVEVAQRLETQDRVNRGLSYRVFGELAEPPDGTEDPALPAGVKVRDVLCARLRITTAEVKRRMRVAARLRERPSMSLTGPPRPPELPVLAAAVAEGAVGEDHIKAVCKALDVLPKVVSEQDKARAEQVLVGHARVQDAPFVDEAGRVLADTLNPDGVFDERDRAIRRGLVLGPQGPDGMSDLRGKVTPEGRAYLEALDAAVRPGHHVPGAEQTVVDAASDGRSKSQRLHDAAVLGWKTALASGQLGMHRGLPLTVIARTTVAELEAAARAVADRSLPMPPPARTGGGSSLPMRDLIRMAGEGSLQYLAVFADHSDRPLYLGRAKRLASADQRIICYARDGGCTHCAESGYHCEVDHAVPWAEGGRTDADSLFFACGPSNRARAQGVYTAEVTDEGRLAWSDGTGPPQVNRRHHPEEILRANEIEDREPPEPPQPLASDLRDP